MANAKQLEDHIPQEEWPDVSKMLEGFGDPSLPASEALVGQRLEIRLEGGSTNTVEFLSASTLHCDVAASAGTLRGDYEYRAVEVRPGIFYIDFRAGVGAQAHDISFVYSVHTEQVTFAHSYMFDRAGTIRTHTDFSHGRVGAGDIEPRSRSNDLVGLRIYYRYSPTEHYEHVYLSPGTFVWHCVKGGERGLADADQTMAFELDDDLLIFYWKETVMPVESFLVIDLKNKRSIGRMFCWDAPSMNFVHLPFDSEFTILNKTEYPTN
jgi:hypothetical protein